MRIGDRDEISNSLGYRMEHGSFAFYENDRLLFLASEVAVLVDTSLGEGRALVLKHGRVEDVEAYQTQFQEAMRRSGVKYDSMVIKSRAWDLDELHKIIFNTGYINLWLKHKKDEDHATRRTPLFAGAGPRVMHEDVSYVLDSMRRLGTRIRELGGWMRLGHSGECDMAFEEGSRHRSILYLPFKGFNLRAQIWSRHISILTELDQKIQQEAIRSVVELHPSRGKLKTRRALLCLARNYLIVMGEHNTPVDGLIYWGIPEDEHGNVKGGTGQTVRFAMSRNIPVYNLYTMNEDQIMAKFENRVEAR